MKKNKSKQTLTKETSENWKSKMDDIGEGKKLTEAELQDLIKKRGY